MHAITIDHPGEPGSLREVPNERPHRGEVLVRVSVAGVNPMDWKIRDGAMGLPSTPRTLGQDFAGTIEAVGEDAADFAPGDRVFGIARAHGSYAEFTSVPVAAADSPIGKIPSRVSDEEAAALPTPGLTALAALDQLHVERGMTILINGAAGAVGSLATQLAAHQRGANVIATVKGSPNAVRGFGADAVVDAATSDVIATVRARHPDGIDAVFDTASSNRETAMRFADLLRAGGAIVSTNHVLDVDALTQRGFAASNITMYKTPQSSRASLEQIVALVGDGKLVVRIGHEFPLHDAPRVLDETKAGKMPGKTVLRVTGTAGTD